MNVLYALGNHISDQLTFRGVFRWKACDLTVRGVGMILTHCRQRIVNETQRVQFIPNMLLHSAHIQFSETPG